MNVPLEVLTASKKIYTWEKANLFKKFWLTWNLSKPKEIEYHLLTLYPMSPELYNIFPFNHLY